MQRPRPLLVHAATERRQNSGRERYCMILAPRLITICFTTALESGESSQ
jgi:hypothetical protein